MSMTEPSSTSPPWPPSWNRNFFVETVFDPHPGRVAGLRRVARSVLESREAPEGVIDSVTVIVSELLSNAIKHGRGRISMRLTLVAGDRLYVEAVGENKVVARVAPPDMNAETGRGLAIVEALSDVWGVSLDGRTTWAMVRLSDETGRP